MRQQKTAENQVGKPAWEWNAGYVVYLKRYPLDPAQAGKLDEILGRIEPGHMIESKSFGDEPGRESGAASEIHREIPCAAVRRLEHKGSRGFLEHARQQLNAPGREVAIAKQIFRLCQEQLA